MAIKGQAVMDFSLEFTNLDYVLSKVNSENPEWSHTAWLLFVVESSNKSGSKAGVVLQSPTREKISRAFHFEFTVSNKKAE